MLLLFVFVITLFLLQNNIIQTTSNQCPLDVQILSSRESECSGYIYYDNYTVAWDIGTISFVTFGVANLGKTTHSLNQLRLTINDFQNNLTKTENLTLKADLPLVLFSGRYWTYNLQSGTCESLTKISLEIDEEWFHFYPHKMIKSVDSTSWPTHWSEVLYYTVSLSTDSTSGKNSNNIPASSLGIFSAIVLVSAISFSHQRKKG